MWRLLLVGALAALGACGNVAKAHNDGPAPDTVPDALSCSVDQLACGTCIDPMTDLMHCGTCDTACLPVGESCVAGHCVDMVTSCSQIHQISPAAHDGFYTLIDQTRVYCDMTDGGTMTYRALGFGEYDIVTPGYDLVTVADLQAPGTQQAFIAMYNAQGGATLVATFTAANCCFKFDASTNELFLGGDFLEPLTTAGVVACDITYSDPAYRFEFVPPANQTMTVAQNPPLATTFFTTNPPTAVDQCSEGMNPAFFWHRTTP